MSSITNINNNSSVVSVGRTTPVKPGKQPPEKSIPVYVSNQPENAIPVIEQNKIQSEVALSLLGIPRAEVALGIFADVNTYDVNPSEWSTNPSNYVEGFGIKHIPEEAGARIEAPRNENSILTSKRFFRYQPGRVSAATFGIKSTVSRLAFAKNPVIRKYGIYDNYDGYYWETRQSGEDDNFTTVRRTQSLYKSPASTFGVSGTTLRGSDVNAQTDVITVDQLDDYRISGKAPNTNISASTLYLKDKSILETYRFEFIDEVISTVETDYAAADPAFGAGYTYSGDFYTDFATVVYGGTPTQAQIDTVTAKCPRDVNYWIEVYLLDMLYNSDGHTSFNTRNFETSEAVANAKGKFEHYMYTKMKAIVDGGYTNFADMAASGVSKLSDLIDITIAFFNSIDTSVSYPAPTVFGTKSRLDTVFDSRKYYWAYYVNEYDDGGLVLTYTDPGASYPYGSTADERIQVIKDKCIRDMVYVCEGYRDDIISGGNAATKYNASMFYNTNSSNDLTVYSQLEGGLPAEISRHTHLRDKIQTDLNDTYFIGTVSATIETKFLSLANLVINNFSVEDTNNTIYGDRGIAGNAILLRDGLLLVHAAVFDPSLLKETVRIKGFAQASNRFKLTSGTVTFGQHVKLFTENGGAQLSVDLQDGGLYKVGTIYDNRGTVFDLEDEDGNVLTHSSTQEVSFQLVNPFVFPKDYDPTTYIANGSYPDGDPYPAGAMFPYMYSETGILPKSTEDQYIGFIDTAIDTSTSENAITLAAQIDSVNFVPEYINWIKNNVKPEYYSVYEYRVPRSRFSTDQLNGEENKLVYSDVAVGTSGKVRPGQPVLNELGTQETTTSAYDFDFTKVTMLKIEFSWYGAVGALFLAYVPVSNGEARWVRVHHLRASNQLKISSLGNATLPITYNVYGGGDELSYGDTETENYGYGNDSHYIVKYGASYYIDGGDRGTVRLYSHNNDELAEVYGRIFDASTGTFSSVDNSIDTSGIANFPDNTFFMNAKIKTNNRTDQNIRVIFTDATKLYLSRQPSDTANIRLIPDRANTVYGIETKEEIVSKQGQKVRNRVQVYPTKLSTINIGSSDPFRLRMKKTPIFQTNVVPTGTFTLDSDFTITSERNALDTSSSTYLADGEEIYGWFRATLGETESITVFGKIYKLGNDYYFELKETYNGTVIITGDFLADKRFDPIGTDLSGTTKITEEKEGLSSVVISTDAQVPIPNTGSIIATLYIQPGTEHMDLASYFDYNKEYLSYPLTNVAETLYYAIDSDDEINLSSIASSGTIGIGTTWEEQ